MDKELLTTEEVAKLLNKSKSTIYKYVQEGKLKPLEDHKWRMRRTRLFPREEVERLISQEQIEGYTTREAAEYLGIHRTTVNKYIQEGQLPAQLKERNGKSVYIIKEDDLKAFEELYISHFQRERHKRRDFYDKDLNVALFQKFTSDTVSEARLGMDEQGNWFFFVPQRFIEWTYEEGIYKHDLKPAYVLVDKQRNTSPGYAKFTFPLDNPLTYEVFDLFYQQVGLKNMQIELNGASMERAYEVDVYVKSTLLETTSDIIIRYLKRHLIEGESEETRNGLFVDTIYDTLSFYLPKKWKEFIRNQAKEQGMDMQEYMLTIVKRHINHKEGEEGI